MDLTRGRQARTFPAGSEGGRIVADPDTRPGLSCGPAVAACGPRRPGNSGAGAPRGGGAAVPPPAPPSLSPAEVATRRAWLLGEVLRRQAEIAHLSLLAAQIGHDGREVEAVAIRARRLAAALSPHTMAAAVLDQVAREAGLRAEDLTGDRRGPAEVSRARWVAMRLLRDRGMSLPTIGRAMRCDHSTVKHGLRRLEQERDREEAWTREAEAITTPWVFRSRRAVADAGVAA